MASSLTGAMVSRASQRQPAIEASLAAGDALTALTKSLDGLRSQIKKMSARRPGDAAITAAHLAGSVAAISAGLHAHKPARDPAWADMLTPGQLLEVYRAALKGETGG